MLAYEEDACSARDIAERRAKVAVERDTIHEELTTTRMKLSEAECDSIDVDYVAQFLDNAFDMFAVLDFERRRDLIHSVISDIVVGRTGGTFTLRIPEGGYLQPLDRTLGGTPSGKREFTFERGPEQTAQRVEAVQVSERGVEDTAASLTRCNDEVNPIARHDGDIADVLQLGAVVKHETQARLPLASPWSINQSMPSPPFGSMSPNE